MATYIWRGTWTAKGMGKINDLPQRYEMTQNAFKSTGAELKDLYITLRTDDWTGIVEAPSEEAMMKALLTIAGTGLAKSQTTSAMHIAKALDNTKSFTNSAV